MICWSCEKKAGEGVQCRACGAVQPADPAADHFQVLGVKRRYDLPLAELEQKYKELTKVLHPDRFVRADPRARRFSLQRSVQLNEAWRVLKDDVKRAEYLLSLAGVQVASEDGTTKQGPAGSTVRMPVPERLLFEVMELREALLAARMAGERETVAALAVDARQRRERALSVVAGELARPQPNLETVAGELVAVRYWQRFLEEASAKEDGAEVGRG